MGDEDKKKLEQKLWDIANELRGKMDADEFRDYILGFIFYKYLSEKILNYANKLLAEDGITYLSLDEDSADGAEYLDCSGPLILDTFQATFSNSAIFWAGVI